MVNVSWRQFIISSRLPKVVRNDVAQNITKGAWKSRLSHRTQSHITDMYNVTSFSMVKTSKRIGRMDNLYCQFGYNSAG